METLYSVLVLDTDTRRWLQAEGHTVPPATQPSCWPTSPELRQVLHELPGVQVSFLDGARGAWDAEVLAGERRLVLQIIPGNDEERRPFSLDEVDPELALRVLEALSHVCGPLAIHEAASNRALVVEPGLDPVEGARRLGGR